jgi:DNA-binding HxlR family transcriptional regulator
LIGKRRKYVCPVDVTLSAINGKWKPLILFQLKRSPRRFGELQSALPRVSHKVLTQQLRQLEHAGLIQRQVQSQPACYALTGLGETLKPALTALAAWGRKHHPSLGVVLESAP